MHFSHEQPEYVRWGDDLRTSLKKSKLIEKRMERRREIMHMKLKIFKDICRNIRLQEPLRKEEQIDKMLNTLNLYNQSIGSSRSFHQQVPSTPIQRIDSWDQKQKILQLSNQNYQQCQEQKQEKEKEKEIDISKNNDDYSCVVNDENMNLANFENLKENQQEKIIDSSGIQVSDYQTPKFVSVQQVESSFVLNSSRLSSDSKIDIALLQKQKDQFKQIQHEHIFIYQTQFFRENHQHNISDQFLPSLSNHFQFDNFNFSNKPIFQPVRQQICPNYFAQNSQNYDNIPTPLFSLTQKKSPSIVVIQPSLSQNIKEQNIKEKISEQEQQIFSIQIDFSKLQVNPDFMYFSKNESKVEKSSKKLFKEKKHKKNSSDQSDQNKK